MAQSTIWLVAAEVQHDLAQTITTWLLGHNATVTRTEGALTVFRTKEALASDSAIVLVSDEATADEGWKTAVRAIPFTMRVIPIGALKNVDYNDPEVLPKRVAEVNFIVEGNQMLDHLSDALVTSPEFYNLRNALMVSASAWEASGRSSDGLMTGLLPISKALKAVRAKRAHETDEAFRDQLLYLERFLKQSRAHAIRQLLDRLPSMLRDGAALVVAALAAVAIALAVPILRRAYTSYVLLTRDTSAQLASTSVIKALDGYSNPLAPDTAKAQLLNEVTSYLDMPWCNTPLSLGYRWALNDVALTDTDQYLWTADGDGALARWDTHTGELLDHTQLSDEPLVCCALSDNGQSMAAMDVAGKVFASGDGVRWVICERQSGIAATSDVRCSASADGTAFVLFDRTMVEGYAISGETLSLVFATSYDRVLAAEALSASEWRIAVVEDGQMMVTTVEGDAETRDALPYEPHATCTADMRGDLLLFADKDGNVYLWNVQMPAAAQPVGLTLQAPLFLALMDDAFAYHDRNAGSHVFDLVSGVDVGTCVAEIPVADRLFARGTCVCSSVNGYVMSQDVSRLLPLRGSDAPQGEARFVGTEAAGSASPVVPARAVNDYLIDLTLMVDGDEQQVLLDGSRRFLAGEAQWDGSLMNGLEEDYALYPKLQMGFDGTVTLVGTPRAEDTAESVCVGTSDGHFYELAVFTNGGSYLVSTRQVPTHAAVEELVVAEDCYWVRDASGFWWQARKGCLSSDVNDLYDEVKGRLTQGVTDELLEAVSDETAERLGLTRVPGADGEAWG